MLSPPLIAQMFLQPHDGSHHQSQKGIMVGFTIDLFPNSLPHRNHLCNCGIPCGSVTPHPWGYAGGEAEGVGATLKAPLTVSLVDFPHVLPPLSPHLAALIRSHHWVSQVGSFLLVLGVSCLLTAAFFQFEVCRLLASGPVTLLRAVGPRSAHCVIISGALSFPAGAFGLDWIHRASSSD